MRIQQACQETGLTKKAIHFYIEKSLLVVKKEKENGYYNLDQEDIEKLHLISLFRNSGISILTMKEIFDYPALTNFFMHRQFNLLKQQLAQQLTQLETISTILDVIPPNAHPLDVKNLTSKEVSDHQLILNRCEVMFPNTDARMIAILLLAPFMEIEVNEYRKYLWDKISADLKRVFHKNLVYLQRLIYSLSPKDIQYSASVGYQLYQKLSESTDTSSFTEFLLQECKIFSQDEQLKQLWELLYEPVLRPSLEFYKSCSETLIQQFNVRYLDCMKKMSCLLKECSEILTSEQGKTIMANFPKQFECTSELYSDLFILFTFRQSIYTRCSITKTKEHILAQTI